MTLSIPFALGLVAQIGLVAHMISFLSASLGTGGAAAALSLSMASAMVGQLAMGILLRKSGRRMAAAINLIIQASGVVLLAVTASPLALFFGCTLFGLGYGNIVTFPALIAQGEFSSVDMPRVVALQGALNQAFMAFGPGLVGIVRDLTASIVMVAMIQCISAGVLLLGRLPSPSTSLSSRSIES